MGKQWTAGEMLQLSSAYWAPCTLQASLVLDIFTILDDMLSAGRTATVSAVAEATGSDERALEMLASALTALDFLERDGNTLLLPEHSRTYLSQRSPDYIGYIIKHHVHLTPYWARLAEAIKSGHPVKGSTIHTEDQDERESFLMGMFNVAEHQAERIAAALDLSGRSRLLDLGGGPGTYAVYFCRANPQLKATIFDRPTSETFAMNVVRRFGLEDRIRFAGGDFLRDPLPGDCDVAWLSQVLHGENPDDAAKLVRRAGEALRPRGLLAIQEFVLHDDHSGPVHPALFGLNMLIGTEGGQAYTRHDIETMLRSAGAESVRRLDVELPMGCGILIGQMPQ